MDDWEAVAEKRRQSKERTGKTGKGNGEGQPTPVAACCGGKKQMPESVAAE